jgi:hypothetical protein
LPSIGQTFQQAAINQTSATPTGQPLQPIQPQPQNNVPQPLAAQQQQQQQPQAKKGLSLTVCFSLFFSLLQNELKDFKTLLNL